MLAQSYMFCTPHGKQPRVHKHIVWDDFAVGTRNISTASMQAALTVHI